MAGACGTCTQCCKTHGIAELKKPYNQWCSHCKIGQGCGIYETRPESCETYECLWLQSQDSHTPLPIELRPDHCKVVLTNPSMNLGHTYAAHVPPEKKDAWETPLMFKVLRAICSTGARVVIGWDLGRDKIVITSGGDGVLRRHKVRMSEPDADGVQWYEPEDQNA